MSNQITRWADSAQYVAEKSDAAAGPTAYLLGGPVDPLGQIAACAFMYTGRVVRDTADVTDDERRDVLTQIQRTALKMPLEAVSLHFMLEGVHRGITHQMVRQRTAAYAQESTRFAVKEDLASATALPPSLRDTLSLNEFLAAERARSESLGLSGVEDELLLKAAGQRQKQRFLWDKAVAEVDGAYNGLVADGMAAEEARGLMPTNITTRLNYITNLRSFYDTMAVRVSDQAQFEWRMVARAYALAMREYGASVDYQMWSPDIEDHEYDYHGELEERNHNGVTEYLVRRSSAWQYVALTEQIRPIEFVLGRPAFEASFDRPSRIGERVKAFAECGVPSSQWLQDDEQRNIPAIHPEEWLLDPEAARLTGDQEFDVYGNRVRRGTGVHWRSGMLWTADGRPFHLGQAPE